ncbi:hypothetical protein Hanom_Chr09g00818471 [Helianthus anomalus]
MAASFGNRFLSQIRTSPSAHANLVVLRYNELRMIMGEALNGPGGAPDLPNFLLSSVIYEGSACIRVRQEHRGSDPPIISPRRSGYPSRTRKVLGTRPKNRGLWASG